jgi:hypothetical protein
MSAIVKYTQRALGQLTGQKSDVIAPGLIGRNKAYDQANEMAGMMQTYYGIDPSVIVNLTPEEIGDFVDKAEQARFFSENVGKLEEHIKDYIQGVVDYNNFIARCVKAGVAGMKKVDKATLDVFLQLQGYEVNRSKLAKDSDVETTKLNQELTDYLDLAEYDLSASLKMMASKLAKRKKEIDNKPNQEDATEQLRIDTARERQRVKNLLLYGTSRAISPSASTQTVNANSNGKGIFSRIGDFFAGR